MPDSDQYFEGYIKAVTYPLPELKNTFEKETKLLTQIIKRYNCNNILDIGTGNGRTIYNLDMKFTGKLFIGTDINNRMISLAESRRTNNTNNSIYFINSDCMEHNFNGLLSFKYDLVYSGYNLIGSIEWDQVYALMNYKKKISRKKGIIITTSWKQGKYGGGDVMDLTTAFLKKYYEYIGYKNIQINGDKSIVDGMTFERFSLDKLIEIYRNFNIKNIEVHDLGLWNAVVGRK